jgi:hypothetical protein
MTGLSELPVELLDAILQYIDIKTLLLAQRVSHTWQNTITASPQLQEALFYRPKPSETPLFTCSWKGRQLHRFGPAKDSPKINPKSTSRTTTQTFTPIKINAFLAQSIYYQPLDNHSTQGRGQRINLPSLGTFLRCPTGSWRSMLLTQPPVPSILVTSTKTYTGNPEVEYDEFESSREGDGWDWDWDCTMGDLVDRMLDVAREDEASAARRLWSVLIFDTVELSHMAVEDVISRYVDGKLAAMRLGGYGPLLWDVAHPVALPSVALC